MWAWGPVIGYMAIIFIVSSFRRLPHQPDVGQADKLVHILTFFGLARVALRAALMQPIPGMFGPYGQSFFLSTIYGVSDEYHQSFVPGRDMNAWDWLADVAGVVLALGLVSLHHRRINSEVKSIVGKQ